MNVCGIKHVRWHWSQALETFAHHGLVLLKDHALVVDRFYLEVTRIARLVASIGNVSVEKGFLRASRESRHVHALRVCFDGQAKILCFLNCSAQLRSMIFCKTPQPAFHEPDYLWKHEVCV